MMASTIVLFHCFKLCVNQIKLDKSLPENVDQQKRDPKTLIYINKSLTPDNRKLLKKAREKAKENHYKYKGYIIKGEIHVKKGDASKCISIKPDTDIDKIV